MDSEITRRQDQLVRAMTPADRFRASAHLRDSAWRLKAAWLRHLHPDWTEAEIQDRVRAIFRDVSA